MVLQSDYLSMYFDAKKHASTLRHAKKTLKNMDFQIIVVRGVSGLLWGTAIARHMKKPLCVVRKKDGHHSYVSEEGYIPTNGEKWIIVDDFISTGNTVETIAKAISGYNGEFVGVYQAHYKSFVHLSTLSELGIIYDY